MIDPDALYEGCNGCRGLITFDRDAIRAECEKRRAHYTKVPASLPFYYRVAVPHGDHYHIHLCVIGEPPPDAFSDDIAAKFERWEPQFHWHEPATDYPYHDARGIVKNSDEVQAARALWRGSLPLTDQGKTHDRE